MTKKPNILNISVWNILTEEQSMLDQARIKLLYYGLFLAFVALCTLSSNVYLQHLTIFSYVTVTLVVAVTLMFKYLTYKPDWAMISHALLGLGTIVNLINVFVVIHEVDVV